MNYCRRGFCLLLCLMLLSGTFQCAWAENMQEGLAFEQLFYYGSVGSTLTLTAIDPRASGLTSADYNIVSDNPKIVKVLSTTVSFSGKAIIQCSIECARPGKALLDLSVSDGRSTPCIVEIGGKTSASAEPDQSQLDWFLYSLEAETDRLQLEQPSPSQLCISLLDQTPFNQAMFIYDTMNNVSDFLGNIGNIGDTVLERRDMYLTVLLELLRANEASDFSAGEYFDNSGELNDFVDSLTETYRNKTLSNADKQALRGDVDKWFRDNHPLAAASADVTDAVSYAFSTFESVDKCVEYCMNVASLYENGQSVRNAVEQMYQKSLQIGEYDLQSALKECLDILDGNLKSAVLAETAKTMGLSAGKMVIGALWWDSMLAALTELRPEIAVWQAVFYGDKYIVNQLVKVDELRSLSLQMRATNDLRNVADAALQDLVSAYKNDRSPVLAQEILKLLDLSYKLRIQDCQIANAFFNAVNEDIAHRFRFLISGEDRTLRTEIQRWEDEYEESRQKLLKWHGYITPAERRTAVPLTKSSAAPYSSTIKKILDDLRQGQDEAYGLLIDMDWDSVPELLVLTVKDINSSYQRFSYSIYDNVNGSVIPLAENCYISGEIGHIGIGEYEGNDIFFDHQWGTGAATQYEYFYLYDTNTLELVTKLEMRPVFTYSARYDKDIAGYSWFWNDDEISKSEYDKEISSIDTLAELVYHPRANRFIGEQLTNDLVSSDESSMAGVEPAGNGQIVYDAINETAEAGKNTISFHIPAISINKPGILQLNQEILDDLKNLMERSIEAFGHYPAPSEGIEYQYAQHGDILSLVIHIARGADYGGDAYQVYNVNVKTGNPLSPLEMFSEAGFAGQDAWERVCASVESAWWEYWGQKAADAKGELDSYNKQALEKTISGENLTSIQPFFDENGVFCAAVILRTPVGSGKLSKLIELK